MDQHPADYASLRFWFNIVQYLITLAVSLYVWLNSRLNAKARELKELARRLDTAKNQMDGRITRLETDMAHALSHEDLAAVYDRLNDMAEQVAGLSGKMDGVKGTVDMIQAHLLNDH
ncbi:hypothetical protein [Desulfoluna spongiiphila]|uniref:DUF2730 family protein n=1 Tax=Desulfoluna spongiiphila TaxID=419481 RepID=A0A1G5ACM3_9BACT|nr:hypothetical protein [Desulfoluna spongiiphila]SCX75609.1 hypothetical protein SAMN05216233_10147 [Desulfoluna spongiiphila]